MNYRDAQDACIYAALPIARAGWNGKGMMVYAVPAGNYPAQTHVAKRLFGDDALVPYGSYLAIKAADGIVYPWVPSQQDIFANDWEIVNL